MPTKRSGEIKEKRNVASFLFYNLIKRLTTYLTINSNKFTLNKNEYGLSNAGHIKMVCQIRDFYFRESQYGRIGTRSNSRADVNDCL